MENILVPYQSVQCISGSHVLVLAPHPDDEVFGCGGAIIRHVEQGHEVRVIIVSDGAYGLEADKRTRYAEIRRQESITAAMTLGAKEPEFWEYLDREIHYGEKLVQQILAEIKDIDLLYAPSVFEMHPDHRALGMAAMEAVRRKGKHIKLAMYEVGMPLRPNTLLDITSVMTLKQTAMACFESQNKVQRYDQEISALNRYRAYTLASNVSHAEAYIVLNAEEVSKDPLKIYQSEFLRQKELGLSLDSQGQPLVSIIIRSMDRGTLSEALDSVSLQTYSNIEVIVVNAKGGVHTELGEYCGRFTLRLLNQNGEQLHRSRAANAGLDDVTGEYIAFLDDDDAFDPSHVEQLISVISNTNPKVLLAYSGVRCRDRADVESTDMGIYGEPFESKAKLLAGNFIPIHAPLFSSELIATVRFDEQFDEYEDWDFWLQLAELTEFEFSNEITATYFLGGQSAVGITSPLLEAQEQAALRILEKWRNKISIADFRALGRLAKKYQHDVVHVVHDNNELNRDKNELAVERNELIVEKNELTVERDELIVARDEWKLRTEQIQIEKDNQQLHYESISGSLSHDLKAVKMSTSWKLTNPLRFFIHQMRRSIQVVKITPAIIRRGGGIIPTIKKTIKVIAREGISGFISQLKYGTQRIDVIDLGEQHVNKHDYQEWVRRYDTLSSLDAEKIRSIVKEMKHKPKISIIMPVFDPPLSFLDEAIQSVREQIYDNWELCIADDASTNTAVHDLLKKHAREDERIKIVFREKNGHISNASNSALELATGNYIALMDNDDLIPAHALYWVADTINNNPDALLFYSDEDKLSEQSAERVDPYFKSDWNPELFLGHNLITHLGVYQADIVKEIGGFRTGFEGAQDYDLAARVIDVIQDEQIIHIPRILYHWRVLAGSTAKAMEGKPYAVIAGEKAINEHLIRRGTKGHVSAVSGGHRVYFDLPAEKPLVSIIIPTRNGYELVKTCIESIYKLTTYPNIEILLVDNDSDEDESIEYFKQLEVQHQNFRIIHDERPFNYSALNNLAVKHAKGELIALLNNDIEVISPDWLDEMVSIALQPESGAVGCKLLYPDNTLQHAGVILGIGGWAGHAHKSFPSTTMGYVARAALTQNFSAVTAACLVVEKEKFIQVNGLNERDLAVACSDVDLCLKLKQAGYRNVWTPFASLYHHESATRGYEDTPEKKERFSKEVQYMHEHWSEWLTNDPAYNPNLTLSYEDFSLAWPPRI